MPPSGGPEGLLPRQRRRQDRLVVAAGELEVIDGDGRPAEKVERPRVLAYASPHVRLPGVSCRHLDTEGWGDDEIHPRDGPQPPAPTLESHPSGEEVDGPHPLGRLQLDLQIRAILRRPLGIQPAVGQDALGRKPGHEVHLRRGQLDHLELSAQRCQLACLRARRQNPAPPPGNSGLWHRVAAQHRVHESAVSHRPRHR